MWTETEGRTSNKRNTATKIRMSNRRVRKVVYYNFRQAKKGASWSASQASWGVRGGLSRGKNGGDRKTGTSPGKVRGFLTPENPRNQMRGGWEKMG